MIPHPRPDPPESGDRDRAWLEVRFDAMLRNLERVRAAAGPGIHLIPMVKADGYGLGALRATAVLHMANPLGWGVATLAEGEELKRRGVPEPVMTYTPLPPESLPRAVAAGLIPAISDLESLTVLGELAASATSPIPFQIELDTGMGRAGFDLDPASASTWRSALRKSSRSALRKSSRSALRKSSRSALQQSSRSALHESSRSNLRLFGVFTHLHSAEVPRPLAARAQVYRFDSFVDLLRHDGVLAPGTLIHCANSAAAMRPRLRSRTANAVRPGIHLYGAAAGAEVPSPEPVAALRARVLLIRNAAPGTTLGYGATYQATGAERWAVLGIGYGDGLPRALGNRGFVLARGRRLPIIGRISMDTTVVRLDDCDLRPGDVVTFFGRDGDTELPLEEVAELVGAIPYEILTGFSPRLPRVPAKQ